MNTSAIRSKIVPHILALLAFLLASGLYFMPEIKGDKIQSHDKMSYVGAAQERMEYQEKGEDILWTSRVFSGMPLYQISYNRDVNLLKNLEFLRDAVPYSMSKSFGLMIGLYIALLLLGLSPLISAVTALTYGFSTWYLLSIEAAHSTKMYSISYVAPFVASAIVAYRGRLWLGAFLMALFMCLMISSNHPQIAYYSLFFMAAVAAVYGVEAVAQKKIGAWVKTSVVLVAFGVISLLPNTSLIWTTYDYSKESTRGGKSELTKSEQAESEGLAFDYAMRWSYGKMESANLLIPGLYAGGYAPGENSVIVEELSKLGVPKKQAVEYAKNVPMYYGSQPFTSGPTYLGASLLFFFLLSFFIVKDRLKWALLSTFILSLFFAWGENFETWNRLFFENMPMFNKFRAPSMWLTLAITTTFIGAALAIKALVEKEYDKEKIVRQIMISGGVLGGIAALFYLFGTSIISDFSGSYDEQLAKSGFPIDALIDERIALMKSDALRTLFFVLATGGLTWLFITNKLKSVRNYTLIVGAILLLDFVPVGLRYLNADDFLPSKGKDLSIVPTAADLTILNDNSIHYRVFNTTVSSFNDNHTSYYHKSVGGYSAVKLYRYQDLIDYHLANGNMKVFNMLNTKYFIQGNPGQEAASQNPDALGAAWLIKEVVSAANADEEMELLNSFSPDSQVVVDQRYSSSLGQKAYSATGSIALKQFHPDRMVYEFESGETQFAVFSEIWYMGNKDWKVYVDGVEKPFVRVNYLLRGMELPAGKHEIVFEFKPKAHYTGVKISYASSALFLVVLVFLGFKAVRSAAAKE